MSASIGFTACHLSFLHPLGVLNCSWADFMPLPSCISWVSTTSSHADTMSTTSPPARYRSTIPGSFEYLRSLKDHATLNSMATILPGIDYSIFYHLCVNYSFVLTTYLCWLHIFVDYSCVSTTRLCRLLIYVDYLSSHKVLLRSIFFGNTVCYRKYLRWVHVVNQDDLDDVGWCTLMRFGTVDRTDQWWQLRHASTKFRLLMATIWSSIVNHTLRTFDRVS